MIKLTQRQVSLVQHLLSSEKFDTAKYYSRLINVSVRTIHNDLIGIVEYLKEHELELEKKPSVGIKVKGSLKNKLKILQDLSLDIGDFQLEELSPTDRKIQIIKLLLLEERKITYQGLSDAFLVSKSSITGDLESINKYLNEYTVKVESNQKGTYIVGTELQKQYTLKLFNERILKETRGTHNLNNIESLVATLKLLYPNELIVLCNLQVKRIEGILGKPIAEHYLMKVLNTLVVLCFRVSDNHHHSQITNRYLLEDICNIDSYKIAEKILLQMECELQIKFTKEDVIYFTQHLIAIGAESNVQSIRLDKDHTAILEDIIAKMGETMKVDLTGDTQLYNGLLTHFIPMIYRLKSGIKISNPLLKEIKKHYSVMLGVTWFVASIIEERLEVKLTEDEVAFMLVHFQAALERNRKSKKILVVCPTGIGTSELIANKVSRILPAHYNIEVVPIGLLYSKDIDHVDFIISAIPLEISMKPVIYISPLVTDYDVKNIANFFTDLIIKEDLLNEELKTPIIKYLPELVSEDSIHLNKEIKDKKEALDFLLPWLVKNKYVTKEYVDSVYNREELGVTALGSGAAIPHGLPKYVKHSRISFLICNKPINWGGQMVDMIVLISISEGDLKLVKNILGEIFDLIETREKVESFFLNTSKQELLQLLKGEKIRRHYMDSEYL